MKRFNLCSKLRDLVCILFRIDCFRSKSAGESAFQGNENSVQLECVESVDFDPIFQHTYIHYKQFSHIGLL